VVEHLIEEQGYWVMPSPLDNLFFLIANQKRTPTIKRYYGTTLGNGSITVPSDIAVGSVAILLRQTYGEDGGVNTQTIPGWAIVSSVGDRWIKDNVAPKPNQSFYTTQTVFMKLITSSDPGSVLNPIDNTNNDGSYIILELTGMDASLIDPSLNLSRFQIAAEHGTGVSLTVNKNTVKNILIFSTASGRDGEFLSSTMSLEFSSDASAFNQIYYNGSDSGLINVWIYEYFPTTLSQDVTIIGRHTDSESSGVIDLISIEL